MRRIPRPTARRGGFTLVELLVAAALSLVVMTVLSLAFQTGMQTLSHLKSVVGMSEQLRAADGLIRADLKGDHLAVSADGDAIRVSDLDTYFQRVPNPTPPVGYLRLSQGEAILSGSTAVGLAPFEEGLAEDGLKSFRTPFAGTGQTVAPNGRASGDYVVFTTRLKGTGPQEVYTTPVGATNLANLTAAGATRPELQAADPTGTQFVSRWAEIAYFLRPNNQLTSDETTNASFPLYTLYRRQRVLAPRTATVPAGLGGSGPLHGLATSGANGTANPTVVVGVEAALTTDAVSAVANRLGGTNDARANPLPTASPVNLLNGDQQVRPYPVPSGASEFGSDVLLNNVVSMTVRPVFGYRVPPAVLLEAVAANTTVASAPVIAPDLSYSPRDMLPFLAAGADNTNYASRTEFPRFFDTGPGGNGIPVRFVFANGTQVVRPVGGADIKLKAIEVKLRVYDAKNKTTRQMTILQDL